MVDAPIAEQTRLARELTRHSSAERSAWPYVILLTTILGGFGLGPIVPDSGHLFGALTVSQSLALNVAGMLSLHARAWMYRRGAGETRAYRAVNSLETVVLYGGLLAHVYLSGIHWSLLWGLCPFTAISWAKMAPFSTRLYRGVIVAAHLTYSAASVGRGDLEGALVAAGVGLLSLTTYEVLARRSRLAVRLQAERNLAQARLSESLLDRERAQIARALREGVGGGLAALVEAIESSGGDDPSTAALAEQAQSAIAELGNVARTQRVGFDSSTLAALGRLLEEKCRPLCLGIAFAQTVEGEPHSEVDPSAAVALLRVCQELVRNAVTHGATASVTIDLKHDGRMLRLSVRDDGSGLSAAALERATGGLSNARQWLGEQGGALELMTSDARGGTELRAALPLARFGDRTAAMGKTWG